MKLAPESRWIPYAVLAPAAYLLVCALLPAGYARTAFGDIFIFLLVLGAAAAMLANTRVTHGHVRAFWAMMALGCILWLVLLGMWVGYEVVLQHTFPRPSAKDMLLFLRVVPMLGALALQPHARWDAPHFRPGLLDFALLLSGWVYLYLFFVIPWQYVAPDVSQYLKSHAVLYAVIRLLYLFLLVVVWVRTQGPWKQVYAHLTVAAWLYTISSALITQAIEAGRFHTGSVYEIPLVTSIAWYIGSGITAYRLRPRSEAAIDAEGLGVWGARGALLAVLSVPVLALWGLLAGPGPWEVLQFRLLVTLAAMFALSFLLFLRQHLREMELLGLLKESRQSYDNLARLQTQLLHAEKLASLGRLVAGAAHEINNPLTAILGYADLMATDASAPPQFRGMADKIREQARRTKVLTSNLLSFAKQAPADKGWLDVNRVVENAIRLRELDLGRGNIRVERDLEAALPQVHADEYQLLQVCLHILNNSVDALREVGGGVIRAATRQESGALLLEFSDTGPGVQAPAHIFDPFYTTKPVGRGAGLGLSAC